MNITVFSLNCLPMKELNTQRHFILQDAKLNQHICFRDILISEFGYKDMLLWEKKIFLLFPQRMKISGWLPDKCGLMDQDFQKGDCEYLQKLLCPTKSRKQFEDLCSNSLNDGFWKFVYI